MNSIETFMKKNNLKPGEKFTIEAAKHIRYWFTESQNLVYEIIIIEDSKTKNATFETLSKLLAGFYKARKV